MNLAEIKFALVALLSILVLVPSSAAFGVSGVVFREEVSPGQELVHEITVSSKEDDSPQEMMAELYGFAMSEGGVYKELSPEEDTGPYSARPFLSIEPKSFTLEPGKAVKLLLTGTVPEDVGSGGRYAIVTITTAPEEGGNVMVSTAIQVLVLLTIKDSELELTGEISDLVASMADGNVSVDLLFENTGNVHYKPLVGAVLLDEAGEIVAQQELKEEGTSILPTNSRLVKMALVPDAVLEPGTYTVEATVALDDGTVLATEDTTVEV
jgi:hypothetical protein